MNRPLIVRAACWALAAGLALAPAALAGEKKPPVRRGKAQPPRKTEMAIEKTVCAKTDDGRDIELFTLTNANGLAARVMTYGATLVGVETPDRQGTFEEITVGLDDCRQYLAGHPCLGSICGRFANRIAKGKFALDGVEYALAINGGPHHIHGGRKGFDKALWSAESFEAADCVGVRLRYVSADKEEGYPGRLEVGVVYSLSRDDALKLEYSARTDKPTILNLTNHAYWNLAGRGTALDHELEIHADHYLPVDATLIPLGEVRSVKGTPMDFTRPERLGARIAQVEPGYDHCYVLNQATPGELTLCARVYEPKSGRTMEVRTTEPGVQLYTANYLDVKRAGRNYGKHDAFCLECQHYPDSPNRASFPSVVLRPGATYRQTTIHAFGVRE